MISRGKDVREQKKIVFPLVAGLSGKFQAIKIRVRNQDELRLAAFVWAHSGVTVGSVWLVGIHHQAGLGMAAMAVKTISASYIEGEHYPVALLDALNRVADFFDHAHDFVTDYGSLLERSTAVIHVQVTAADTCSCDS